MLFVRVNVLFVIFFGLGGFWEVFWCFEFLGLSKFIIFDFLKIFLFLFFLFFGDGEGNEGGWCGLVLGDFLGCGVVWLMVIGGLVNWESVLLYLECGEDYVERSGVEVGWFLFDSWWGGIWFLKFVWLMGLLKCLLRYVNDCFLLVGCRFMMLNFWFLGWMFYLLLFLSLSYFLYVVLFCFLFLFFFCMN